MKKVRSSQTTILVLEWVKQFFPVSLSRIYHETIIIFATENSLKCNTQLHHIGGHIAKTLIYYLIRLSVINMFMVFHAHCQNLFYNSSLPVIFSGSSIDFLILSPTVVNVNFFWRCFVSLMKFSYWYKFHVNIITGSGVLTIFFCTIFYQKSGIRKYPELLRKTKIPSPPLPQPRLVTQM